MRRRDLEDEKPIGAERDGIDRSIAVPDLERTGPIGVHAPTQRHRRGFCDGVGERDRDLHRHGLHLLGGVADSTAGDARRHQLCAMSAVLQLGEVEDRGAGAGHRSSVGDVRIQTEIRGKPGVHPGDVTFDGRGGRLAQKDGGRGRGRSDRHQGDRREHENTNATPATDAVGSGLGVPGAGRDASSYGAGRRRPHPALLVLHGDRIGFADKVVDLVSFHRHFASSAGSAGRSATFPLECRSSPSSFITRLRAR